MSSNTEYYVEDKDVSKITNYIDNRHMRWRPMEVMALFKSLTYENPDRVSLRKALATLLNNNQVENIKPFVESVIIDQQN